MGLSITTNIASMTANRFLTQSAEQQNKAYQRLSSGQRITQAGDDAAGLSISENLRAQLRSMGQAERNANDGISFAQVAEGGLSEISNITVRLRELAIQASSDTIGDRERGFIHQEVKSLVSEVDRIANVTNFNGTNLLNGQSAKGNLEFQVGIRNDSSDRIIFDANAIDVRTRSLGIEDLDYRTVNGAHNALERVDSALTQISSGRASLGAIQNKLQSTSRNLGVSKENLAIARSRIADADIANETSELIRGNILQSAGISVAAQANSAPNVALKLL
jgi:flagellin